ncbi:HD domain-containing protein 2 [Verticillium dahliae VDG1]|nr:HD domain-containing protein 2 [Verticillium dahliae VDG1]
MRLSLAALLLLPLARATSLSFPERQAPAVKSSKTVLSLAVPLPHLSSRSANTARDPVPHPLLNLLDTRQDGCGLRGVECDSEWCAPFSGICCGWGNGSYCDIGTSCDSGGCCPLGKICTGDPSGCTEGQEPCGDNQCMPEGAYCDAGLTCAGDGFCSGGSSGGGGGGGGGGGSDGGCPSGKETGDNSDDDTTTSPDPTPRPSFSPPSGDDDDDTDLPTPVAVPTTSSPRALGAPTTTEAPLATGASGSGNTSSDAVQRSVSGLVFVAALIFGVALTL